MMGHGSGIFLLVYVTFVHAQVGKKVRFNKDTENKKQFHPP